jgi:signal transduction histidine kinase
MMTLATEKSVLLVNDSPDHLELLTIYLRKVGYRVVTARDGREALCAAQGEPFDLIVSDVMMPHMTGIELCRRIRGDRRFDAVPILLVSALRKDSESVVEGISAGADDYLEMPFEPMVFVAKAARLVERAGHTKTLGRRVQERTRQLEEANRELETFSYSVSHDLRAPLACIGNYVGALERRLGERADEPSRELLSLAAGQVGRALELIAALLDYSRLARTETHHEELDADALVRDVIGELDFETRARNVEWKIGALPPLRADAAMLRLALHNLIGNALKYTRPREVAEIEIGAAHSGGETIFHVRDNGVGFDARRAGKLFGVFQRLHDEEEFEGTGVGLANVRRIIERHGGRVWAEGAVGAGATFYFSLPRAASSATIVG